MMQRQLWLVLGFLGSATPFLLAYRVNVVKYDEGFIVTGAMMALHGQLPYRDFLTFYGPAQYYVLAILFRLFGENLIVSRIEHVLCLAAFVPVLVITCKEVKYEPVNRSLPLVVAGVFIAAALISLPNASYPAIPATLLLLTAYSLLKRQTAMSAFRDASIASVCLGVAGLFRWDFGVFGILSAAAAVVLIGIATGTSYKTMLRSVFTVTSPATAIMLFVYLPLLILGDPVRWYREILYFSLFELAKYRSLEFVRPAYWELLGAVRSGNVIALYDSLFRLLFIATPVILVAVTLPLVIYRAKNNSSRIESFTSLWPPAFLALLCAALLNQMRVRPTLWQGFPALVISLPLLTYSLAAIDGTFSRPQPALKIFTSAFALPVFAVLVTLSVESLLAAVSAQVAPFNIHRAAAIKLRRDKLAYAQVVHEVAQRMNPGDFIYSGPLDHSRLFINESLLYFLVGARPATRFIEMDPGVANTEGAQHEICDALLRRNVRVAALLDFSSRESNLSSQSNEIHVADKCVREIFQFVKTVGAYSIYVRR